MTAHEIIYYAALVVAVRWGYVLGGASKENQDDK